MSLFDIGFGWLLGFGGSFILRWHDRRQKVTEFKKGLNTELHELLPLLLGNLLLLKDKLGQIDRNFLVWYNLVYPKNYNFSVKDTHLELLELLLNLPPEQLSALMQVRQSLKDTARGKGLKKFYLNFYQSNISSISFFPADFQSIVFKIHNKLELINQEIDRYFFFFDKTFDPKSADVNLDILQKNMNLCYKTIINILLDTVNEIINLLSILDKGNDDFLSTLKSLFN